MREREGARVRGEREGGGEADGGGEREGEGEREGKGEGKGEERKTYRGPFRRSEKLSRY